MLLAVIAASVLAVVLAGIRPSYDGFGFLVWGRQVLHWNLNTDGAPSWKPLPFLFTLPYAAAGHVQMWLWMTTAMAGALGSAVLAARLAFRITGPAPGRRRFAPYVAGAFAGVGVLGIGTYSHLVLIANSDPLIVRCAWRRSTAISPGASGWRSPCWCWRRWGGRRRGRSPACTPCGRGAPCRRCGG